MALRIAFLVNRDIQSIVALSLLLPGPAAHDDGMQSGFSATYFTQYPLTRAGKNATNGI